MLMVPNSWSCFAIEALWVQYGGSDFDIKTKKALGDLDERAKGRVHTCNTSLLIFQKRNCQAFSVRVTLVQIVTNKTWSV